MNFEKFNKLSYKNFYHFPKGFDNSPFLKIKNRILIACSKDKKDELFKQLKVRGPINRSLVFDLDTLCFDLNSIDSWNVGLSSSKNTPIILPALIARTFSMLGQLFFRVKGFNYIIFVTSATNFTDIKGIFTHVLLLDIPSKQHQNLSKNLCDDIVNSADISLSALNDVFIDITTTDMNLDGEFTSMFDSVNDSELENFDSDDNK